MSQNSVRYGGAVIRGAQFVRSGGLFVEGRYAPFVANTMSADVYPVPPWTPYLVSASPVAKFSDGTDRNRLLATGTTADFHTAGKIFTVSAGPHRLSVVLQADTTHLLEMDLYAGASYFDWAGRTNLTAGTNSYGATMTSLGGGVWRYEKAYTIPPGTTQMEVRILVLTAAGASSYAANGEAFFGGLMTFNPA